MTLTNEEERPISNKKLVRRWILIIGVVVLVGIVAFVVWGSSSPRASQANAPLFGNLLSMPGDTPTATLPPTETATATQTATATLVPTSTLTPTPLPTFTATATPEIKASPLFDDVEVYSGPGEYYTLIREVTRKDTLTLVSQLPNNLWLHIKTVEGEDGWIYSSLANLEGIDIEGLVYETPIPTPIPTPVALAGIEGHWIDVDLGDQMVYAFDGQTLMGSFMVSTGTSAFPTETGQYHIYAKLLYSTMDGADFFLPDVPWTMFYNRDFSFHGTYWHHNFGTPMSHGCINMSIADAKFLYNFSEIGTFVNIHY